MANPEGKETGAGSPGDRNEFIELYNRAKDTIDLSGWRFTDFDATDELSAWTDTLILKKYPDVKIRTTLLPPHSFAVILDPEYTSTDTVGGYSQPYEFPKGTLILTIGNTTLGNGLSNNDPILLYSPDMRDSSSFGTPFDESDSIPRDAGDGISWERVSPDSQDTEDNWVRCLDPSSSTPGKENSTLSYIDIGIEDLSFSPPQGRPETPLKVSGKIKNYSYIPVQDWSLLAFVDRNSNGMEDEGERLSYIKGGLLLSQKDTTIEMEWDNPEKGVKDIYLVVSHPEDRNPANDTLHKAYTVFKTYEYLIISPNPFSPDGDGRDDTASIQYLLPEPEGTLTLMIYDLKGRLVKTLLKNEKIEEESGWVKWDGRGDNNKILPLGMYIVLLKYKKSGRVWTQKKTTVLAKKL